MNQLYRFTLLTAIVAMMPAIASATGSPYFSVGKGVILEYQGTSEFNHKQVSFTQSGSATYVIRSSGDQSPSKDTLISRGGYTYWVLGSSGEEWLKLKNTFRAGDRWQHRLRGWNQTYRVVLSDLTVKVPAGEFKHCAKIAISWVAREHDMDGQQRIDLYLAPNLGVIKKTVYSGNIIEHEEVATSYVKVAGNR
jgi:hypothetical protein